jgi:hypothetical protein
MVPQDGSDKQDCENQAAKRWLAEHGARYARLRPVYLGDDLFFRQPLCEAVRKEGASFIFVCKPSSHPLIEEYLTGIDPPCVEEKIKRGKTHAIHRYHWLCDVPLRDGKDALRKNEAGLRSRSSTRKARPPIATAGSPICPSVPTTSSNSRPAAAPDGRSRTRPSTC